MGLTVAVIVHQFAMCPRGIANQACGHSRHPNVLPQDWQVGEALGKAKCVLENTRQCPCAQGRIGFCIFSCHTACKNQMYIVNLINLPLYVCGLFCTNYIWSASVSQKRQGEVVSAVFDLQVRDEAKRLDPGLVEFQKLPEKEKNQNLQMAQITIKYISTLLSESLRF
jgi:hypothetical protein